MPFCSQGVISCARRSAKAEVRGANPRESANFEAPVPQQPQGGFRKPVFVGASPTRGSSFNGDHDVTVASRPVKAFVPVRIRLVTPIQGRDVTVSISACDVDCAGANPVALTNFNQQPKNTHENRHAQSHL